MKLNNKFTHVILGALLMNALPCAFSEDNAGSDAGAVRYLRENTEWCDARILDTTKTNLPHVLLVGDSITQGYYPLVEKRLAGKAYCGRLTTSACVADPSFLKQLEAFLVGYKLAVVHINNGLHGWPYSDAEYKAGYEKTLALIKRMQPDAKVIVALTTPLKPGSEKEHLTPQVDARNKIATELAAKYGAEINDLYAVSKGHPEYYSDPYHHNAGATALQSEKVTATVLAALGIRAEQKAEEKR